MSTRLVEIFLYWESRRCAGKILQHLIDILVIAVYAVIASFHLLSAFQNRRHKAGQSY